MNTELCLNQTGPNILKIFPSSARDLRPRPKVWRRSFALHDILSIIAFTLVVLKNLAFSTSKNYYLFYFLTL